MIEAKRNKNDFCNLLLNVDEIFVRPCFVDDYIKFSHELDEYLCCKYSEFYAGLQLYQSQEDKCRFTIVMAFYEVPCICHEVEKIMKDIDEIYKETWRNNIKRVCILSFLEEKRII